MKNDNLVVVLDGVSQLEYRRSAPLDEAQSRYLGRMDARMDQGIVLSGMQITAPDALQRAQFIAMQLLQAVQAGEEPVAAAMLAYLANRMPDMKQVRATTRGEALSFDLVFDRAYAKEVKVEFVKPGMV
ncbi:MAG: hypothetical protein WCZ87_01125 [Thiohalobacteraceae bacterium]